MGDLGNIPYMGDVGIFSAPCKGYCPYNNVMSNLTKNPSYSVQGEIGL